MQKNSIAWEKLEREAGDLLVDLIYYYRAKNKLRKMQETKMVSKQSKESLLDALQLDCVLRYNKYADMRTKMEQEYGFYLVDEIITKAFSDWKAIDFLEDADRFSERFIVRMFDVCLRK